MFPVSKIVELVFDVGATIDLGTRSLQSDGIDLIVTNRHRHILYEGDDWNIALTVLEDGAHVEDEE